MENITLQSMLNEFAKKSSMDDQEPLKFERFVNYSLLVNEHYDSFDLDNVGMGECIGVDGLAISLNGVLLYSEIEAKESTNCQFDAHFHFIQSKTSSSLDLGDYLKFLNTVLIFFTRPENEQPPELIEAFRIKQELYSKASRFRINPVLEMSYVYTGSGVINDKSFIAQTSAILDQIKSIPYLFSKVKDQLIGANSLVDKYKETLNRTTKNLVYQRHVALPKLTSATAAYLGVAKCIDYIEILKNHEGGINKGVFYDNVRDFLGSSNPVNDDIETTIKSETQRSLFSVLNNGVTVVAKKVVPSGDTFEISGYQVVNGCQTSHVLFNNKDIVTDDMYITVKLIETNDIDLSSSVIKATNSQSVVMKEAFATIKPYHKRLEDFFSSANNTKRKFYYERRPHQYDDNQSISNSQIVSAPLLIKAFVSVVIEEPHKVHFYYGQILKDYNNEKTTLLFEENHHPGLYYISQLICSKSRDFALKQKLGSWSYHIAMLTKKRLGIKLNVSDKLSDKTVMNIIETIEAGFGSACTDVISLIKQVKLHHNDHMLADKTTLLLREFSKRYLDNRSSKAELTQATEIAQAKAEPLFDGAYAVSELNIDKYNIKFKYGPNSYSYPNFRHFELQTQPTKANLTIKDGKVVNVKL